MTVAAVLPKARQAMRRLRVLTERVCVTCESVTRARCCSPDFCRIVRTGLEVAGLDIPHEPNGYGVPFLDPESGCVVAPELRPACTGYACTIAPELARDRAKLMARGLEDPTVAELARVGSRLGAMMVDRMLGTNRAVQEHVRDVLSD